MKLNKFNINKLTLGEITKKVLAKELIYDPFYQRKSVWEDIHKVEFIKTILNGYPCPEIFLAEGEYDLETYTTYTHVIDGQQRVRTITEFMNNKFKVEGEYYKDFNDEKKKEVASYEIPVVYLELNPETDEEKIKEIFYRLNMTNYGLGDIELTLSQFSNNEYMLLSRLLSGEDVFHQEEDNSKKFRDNPFIKQEFKDWAMKSDFKTIGNIFSNEDIYSAREIKRSWNTMDILNIIAIFLNKRFHGRNLKDIEIEELTSSVSKRKEEILNKFAIATNLFIRLELNKGKRAKSKFYQRGSFFSLFIVFLEIEDENKIDLTVLRERLIEFEKKLPIEYKNASLNSVHERKQREIRNDYLKKIVNESIFF